tara:strand:+ start:945 stop:1316 length:372 start_codon:yes stop_codon:yes gene_type:complete
MKDKGLGDTIERITKATGIKKIVDKVSELTGKPCNCSERRDKLNKMFPYNKVRQFTEDELKIYKEVLPRLKGGTITGQDQAVLVRLYNKVFNANKKPSSCSSCVQQTIAKLAKVYVNSCDTNG